MTYKDILRINPHLKICNIGNITKRLLRATNQNAFIVWNNLSQQYELHTVSAARLSYDSLNCPITLDVINQWIINDYNMNDLLKYMDDIKSERELSQHLNDYKNSNEYRDLQLKEDLKAIERTLGSSL